MSDVAVTATQDFCSFASRASFLLLVPLCKWNANYIMWRFWTRLFSESNARTIRPTACCVVVLAPQDAGYWRTTEHLLCVEAFRESMTQGHTFLANWIQYICPPNLKLEQRAPISIATLINSNSMVYKLAPVQSRCQNIYYEHQNHPATNRCNCTPLSGKVRIQQIAYLKFAWYLLNLLSKFISINQKEVRLLYGRCRNSKAIAWRN